MRSISISRCTRSRGAALELDGEDRKREIAQISVTVRDIERAIPWYRDVLGIKFLIQAQAMGFFDSGGIRLMLAEPQDGTSSQGSSILYFRVSDIAGELENMRRRGVRIIRDPRLTAAMPDHDLWMAFFEDSEGNTLALMEEKPSPGGGWEARRSG